MWEVFLGIFMKKFDLKIKKKKFMKKIAFKTPNNVALNEVAVTFVH